MWYFLYLSLGIAALGLFTQKGKKVVKFTQILFETIQNNAKNPKVKPEFELINRSHTIKYGDVYLNGINTSYHYDVMCFTSNAFLLGIKEKHNYNPIHEICEKVPLTLIRSGSCISSIPFRPSDFNFNRLYIAIKRISNENYSIYEFENKDYINLLDIIARFEKDLISEIEKNESVSLAEAYD
jgi:hypothetical protein